MVVLASQSLIRFRPSACWHSAELTTFTDVQRGGLSDAITLSLAPLQQCGVNTGAGVPAQPKHSSYLERRTDTVALGVNNSSNGQ